ncbi:hypothetical protein [Sphingobacterium athyrii]|uniref:Uncharacterized protein n=1 Tax=Sphingobacterium athyrii TaxID=2152717 RepID=A0A363NXL3_9SPHI|nr:hypothetical protein [Sphingobacterium athyrii]PUV25477.1 hypothetical protein DCO56_00310 [Sphingobacterium athyrii]
MGFGANLVFVYIFAPVLAILILYFILTGNRFVGKAIVSMIAGAIFLSLLSLFIQWVTAPKILKKEDYYGTYHVKRDLFPGEQTDWQYNTYTFEIKSNDSIYFKVLRANKVSEIYRGKIETITPYRSARLKLYMDFPTHHILDSDPTIYRNAWGFYLVFYSPKYNNVFFEKD